MKYLVKLIQLINKYLNEMKNKNIKNQKVLSPSI